MAVYDLTTVPNKSFQIYGSHKFKARTHIVDIAVDMATQAAGDVAKVVPIYAGEYVWNVFTRVVTASTTGSSTVTVGDSASTTAWLVSGAATTTASYPSNGVNVFTQSGTTPFAVTWVGGKLYTASDYVSVVLGATAPANGQIEVTAIIYEVGTAANV